MTTVSLSEEDQALIERLSQATGVRSVTDLVRLSLRVAWSTRGNVVSSFETRSADEELALVSALGEERARAVLAGGSPLARHLRLKKRKEGIAMKRAATMERKFRAGKVKIKPSGTRKVDPESVRKALGAERAGPELVHRMRLSGKPHH